MQSSSTVTANPNQKLVDSSFTVNGSTQKYSFDPSLYRRFARQFRINYICINCLSKWRFPCGATHTQECPTKAPSITDAEEETDPSIIKVIGKKTPDRFISFEDSVIKLVIKKCTE